MSQYLMSTLKPVFVTIACPFYTPPQTWISRTLKHRHHISVTITQTSAFHISRTMLQNRSAKGSSGSKPGDKDGASDVDEEANKSNWDARVVDLDNGMQGLVCGGRITSYIDPHKPGRIKDRLVDRQLLDEYGATNIDDLTEGQLAEYLASKCEGEPY